MLAKHFIEEFHILYARTISYQGSLKSIGIKLHKIEKETQAKWAFNQDWTS